MSNELVYRGDTTATTVKATIRNSSRQYWNTNTTTAPAFETLDPTHWYSATATEHNYCIALVESPANSYLYVGNYPSMAAGWYYVDIYAGITIGSALIGTQYGYWDGTNYCLDAANVMQIIGHTLTEVGGAGRLAAAISTFGNVESPVFTAASINQTGDAFSRLGATPPTTAQIATAIWHDLVAGTDFDNPLSIGVLINSMAKALGLSTTVAGTKAAGADGGIPLLDSDLRIDTNANILTILGETPSGLITGKIQAVITPDFTDADRTKLERLDTDYTNARAVQLDYLDAAITTRHPSGNIPTKEEIATQVELQIISETDSNLVLKAITDKISSVNPSLSGITLSAIASQVRTELATELSRIDDTITSRHPSGYAVAKSPATIDFDTDVYNYPTDFAANNLPIDYQRSGLVSLNPDQHVIVDSGIITTLMNMPNDIATETRLDIVYNNLSGQYQQISTSYTNERAIKLDYLDTYISSRHPSGLSITANNLPDDYQRSGLVSLNSDQHVIADNVVVNTLENIPNDIATITSLNILYNNLSGQYEQINTWYSDIPTSLQVSDYVRSGLSTELGRLDVNISTRLATMDYISPTGIDLGVLESNTGAIKLVTDKLDSMIENV